MEAAAAPGGGEAIGVAVEGSRHGASYFGRHAVVRIAEGGGTERGEGGSLGRGEQSFVNCKKGQTVTLQHPLGPLNFEL